MLYNPSGKTVSSYFNTFYRELVRLKVTPRVHFGMYFDLELRRHVYDTYPRLPEFLKIREELDPNDMFLNQLMKTVFDIWQFFKCFFLIGDIIIISEHHQLYLLC